MPAQAQRVRRAGTIQRAGVAHHLRVVDVRLYCVALGEKRKFPLLQWAGPGSTIGSELGLTRYKLQPDGLAFFASEQVETVIALEVDTGSEPAKVLLGKLDRYIGVAAEGHIHSLWILNFAGERRGNTLLRLLKEADLDLWGKVFSHELVMMRPVQEPPSPRGGNCDGD